MTRFFLVLILISGFSFRQATEPEYEVLFVGNSLTYTHDLPSLFTSEAARMGHKVTTYTLALPNYALEDHLADGRLQKVLISNKYDFVIVQQGPSSQADGRAMLLKSGRELSKICKKEGSKLAFFMVWPAYQNYQTFDGVIRNYSLAAAEVNAILCPVGSVWKEYIDKTGDLSYYGPDLFHPSRLGSTVAARVIAESLFGK